MLQHVDTMIGFVMVMLLLSLLVTILVQIVANMINMRGVNLLWGVTCLFTQVLKTRKDSQSLSAKKLAKDVLLHPTVCHNGVLGPRCATAIREDELIRVLRDLARNDSQVKALLGGTASDLAEIAREIDEKELVRLFPEETEKARAVLARLRAGVEQDLAELKAWYATLMDRTSERFVAHTRLATAFFAVVLSFGLSIDSLDLLKQISSDAELRARLVQGADAMLKTADEHAGIESEANHLASDALKATRTERPTITPDEKVPDDLRTRLQGRQWIDAHIEDPAAREDFTRVYERHYDDLSRKWGQKLVDTAAALSAKVTETELVLTSAPTWPWQWSRRHALGMFMTALFLSLGSPFWYNLLRKLSNLRPLIAGKVDASDTKKPAPQDP